MRKGLFFLLLFCGGNGFAQNVIVEESLTETRCESKTHMTTHYKETKTILNEQGADHAHFLCSCNKQERLTSFRGQVTDASGKVIRKIKERSCNGRSIHSILLWMIIRCISPILLLSIL